MYSYSLSAIAPYVSKGGAALGIHTTQHTSALVWMRKYVPPHAKENGGLGGGEKTVSLIPIPTPLITPRLWNLDAATDCDFILPFFLG